MTQWYFWVPRQWYSCAFSGRLSGSIEILLLVVCATARFSPFPDAWREVLWRYFRMLGRRRYSQTLGEGTAALFLDACATVLRCFRLLGRRRDGAISGRLCDGMASTHS